MRALSYAGPQTLFYSTLTSFTGTQFFDLVL